MFCPLLNRHCLEKGCAWWHETEPASDKDDFVGACAISMISFNMNNFQEDFEEMAFDIYKLRLGDDIP